jgi:hypothetical protein
MDGGTLERQEQCVNSCKAVKGVTGCELIWGLRGRGCYAHTEEVRIGSGIPQHYCWVFSKCKEGIEDSTSS